MKHLLELNVWYVYQTICKRHMYMYMFVVKIIEPRDY